MKTEQVVQLDYREEENKKIIQKVLRLIKPLSKYSEEEDIPLSGIEKAIVVMSKKYQMHIREFVPDVWSNSNGVIWRVTIVNDVDLKTIDVIYGISIYEVFAKAAIQMYAQVRKGIPIRE